MGIRTKNPTSPGVRHQISDTYEDITKNYPEKSLLGTLVRHAGRDNQGRISMRHRGGGNYIRYRMIDFKRKKDNIPAKVVAFEYDPNRNCRIALLHYIDGEKSYILAPLGLEINDTVMSGEDAEIRPGNCLPLKSIPVGTTIHNVELTIGRGGQLARSAGSMIVLLGKEGGYAIIKMPSGEQRMVNQLCRATVGQVGNIDAKNVVMGKAGKKRHLRRRPEVRGVVMNPCDHPHGGGEGKSGIGRKRPVSKWGQLALGGHTRKSRKPSSRFILVRRK